MVVTCQLCLIAVNRWLAQRSVLLKRFRWVEAEENGLGWRGVRDCHEDCLGRQARIGLLD